MAVTLQQMATAYIQQVQTEIQRAEGVVQENIKYVESLKKHLEECESQVSLNQTQQENRPETIKPQVVETVSDDGKTVTTTTQLPNPFEQLQNS